MKKIIPHVSIYAMLGVFMFTLSIFLPAHASMEDNMIMKDENMTKHMMKDDKMMANIDPPTKQIKHGVSIHDIKCSNGFTLALKSTNNSPACVKSSSFNVLVARGWARSADTMMKIMDQYMTHDMVNMKNDTMKDEHMMKNETNDNKMTMKDNMENKSMNDTMSENKMSHQSSAMHQSSVDENQYPNAPALVGITNYINTTPAKLAQDMKGKVIVYDFWTFNCINCIHTLPHVVDLSNKYLGKDVLVIGIHSPETFTEKDLNNVRNAVHQYNIQYPVVLDNDFQTWNAFGNHYWPRVYVADSHGKIRYDHIGEGAYDEIDKTVASLLAEHDAEKPKELAMG